MSDSVVCNDLSHSLTVPFAQDEELFPYGNPLEAFKEDAGDDDWLNCTVNPTSVSPPTDFSESPDSLWSLERHLGLQPMCLWQDTAPKYKCAECGLLASTVVELEEHGQNEGHKSFACPEPGCQKSYSRRDCHSRHRSRHKADWYTCKLCGHKCKRKDNLESHLKRIHGKQGGQRSEDRSRQSSLAPLDRQRVQQALPSLGPWKVPEKSGLKCVVGTLRHIIDDDPRLAHLDSMIDELDFNGTQDLAQKLAWTMISHTSAQPLSALTVR